MGSVINFYSIWSFQYLQIKKRGETFFGGVYFHSKNITILNYLNVFFPQVKVTRHLCFKNSKNLQALDILAYNSANKQSFQNLTKSLFAPLLRWKKCSDILKVASVGGGEIANPNACHFVKNDRPSDVYIYLRQQMLSLKYHCTFFIYGALAKMPFSGF